MVPTTQRAAADSDAGESGVVSGLGDTATVGEGDLLREGESSYQAMRLTNYCYERDGRTERLIHSDHDYSCKSQ